MALKKIIDIGEAFPVRMPRLAAAPPLDDVLEDISAAQAAPAAVVAQPPPPVSPQTPTQVRTTALPGC